MAPSRTPLLRLGALAGMVIFNVVLSSASQDALFLAHHPAKRIPVAMLVGSLATALVTVTIHRLLRGRSPATALRFVLVGLGVGAAAVAAWNLSPGAASSFSLFLFVELANALGPATTWAWFQAPLEPSEVRRVLPRLSLFAGAGGLAASGTIRLVLHLSGGRTQALVLVSSVMWFAALLLVGGHREPAAPRHKARAVSAPVARLALVPLARWMVVGSAGVIWMSLILQYLLRVELRQHLAPAEIARTMGLLLGAVSALGMTTQLLITPRILEKWGAAVALVVLPLGCAICLGFWLYLPLLALVGAAALIDRTLRPNLHRSAESCLIGAVSPSLRPALLMVLFGVVTPLLKAVGALVLWGAASVPGRWIAVGALVLAGGLGLLGLRWGRLYTRTLRDTLEDGNVDASPDEDMQEALPEIDGPRLRQLLEAVDGGSQRARTLALELLLPHRASSVARAMAARTASPVEAVRIAALRWHAAEPEPVLGAHLRARWAEPSISPAERIALLEAAGPAAAELVGGDARRWLAAPTEPPTATGALAGGGGGGGHLAGLASLAAALRRKNERDLRTAAVTALRRSSGEARDLADAAARAMIGAADVDDRLAGLRVARDSPSGDAGLLGPVLAALRDPALAVRRAAVECLPTLGETEARSALWAAIGDPLLAPSAVRALAAIGDPILPATLAALDEGRLPAGPLVRLLGQLGGHDGLPVLLRQLSSPHAALQHETLKALDRIHARTPLPDEPAVRELLTRELRFGLRLLRAQAALAARLRARDFLARELAARVETAREHVCRALTLLGPPDTVVHALRSVRARRSPHRDHARELLRSLLRPGPLLAGSTRLLEADASTWPAECDQPPLDATAFADDEAALAWLGDTGDPWIVAALRHDPSFSRPLTQTEDPMEGTLETLLFLKDVLLFEALTNPQLVAVARLAEKVELPAGHRLFRQGELPDDLYIVRTGKLRVLVDGADVAHLGPGECAGEMGVLAGTDRSATVETSVPSRLLRFNGEDFLAVLDTYPEISRALLRSLVRRLSQAVTSGAPLTIDGLIHSRAAEPRS